MAGAAAKGLAVLGRKFAPKLLKLLGKVLVVLLPDRLLTK